ncbi:MAG: DUF2892 domain-containing protein [Planctomycetota bacterium]|jgi:hypothetical protein|nr:hypothetical protein [Planctomycetota bacterium]MDP6518353.1 DUF2892 domain-containing protein [Planctomycetota bacterium]MDP6839015.1 DUF2892 domain-containing protein [Planctomycetota bacterium]MDP6955517.1 DUF2892 domain-containing protein [Planctomycetota bacterium]
MRTNVGPADRHARITIGLAILALGWFAGSTWAWIGLFPIITGLTKRCPGYRPFDIDTTRSVGESKAAG